MLLPLLLADSSLLYELIAIRNFSSRLSLYLNTCIFLATGAFRISSLECLTFFLTLLATADVSLIFNCRV